MSVALISACNSALAKIAKASITDINEGSIEAEYCAIFAPEILAEMGDWTDWPDLEKRVSLAGVPNDRASEWNFAYALPADFGEPIAIRRPEEPADSLPIYATPFTMPSQDRLRVGFAIRGGKLYTNVKDAIFVYTSGNFTAENLSPKMRRAFIDELAFRLASPVAKSSSNRLEQLKNEATISRLEAISDAQNKNERFEPSYISMAELARRGVIE